ncbi:ABC transporter permease [Ignisphaera sp. 4213-co]|uniref:ABC transporter permease n=1 Tax=Ignisphaera cupida TaxID=3050454 RepID=A0ABD4Z7Y9_9CREN|nr:ABC transporter permease [Ignisphaera sp. 4213-co]MDK6028223.1 ABC transporter permease [Ignisphaera sp. 4213-co]
MVSDKRFRISPVVIFLVRRSAFLITTYFIALTIVFILPRAIPGNPLALLLTQLFQQAQTNPEAIREVYKKLMEEFGIGKPIYVQYIEFLSRAFRGDLGTSIAFYPKKVIDLIAPAIPWTLALLVPATISAWTVGNLIGAVAGYKRGSKFEKTVLISSLILSQTPYYWLAMLLMFVLAVRLNIFPYGGAYSQDLIPSFAPQFILDVLWHYVLPFLSIFLSAIGGWAIGMRVLTIYELGSDYMTYSESLGVKESIIFKYAFRNSLLPQVTGLALSLGSVLGGALITEVVFNYPGTGYILFRGLSTLDYPLIQGVFVILIATLYIANFAVDFVYALIDPRIRLAGEKV